MILQVLDKGDAHMPVREANSPEKAGDDIRSELIRIYIRRKSRKGIELTAEDLTSRFLISESQAVELLSEIPGEWKKLFEPHAHPNN